MKAIDVVDWLTPTQAAFRLRISAEAVRHLCNQGRLVVVRTGHGRLIDPESVERLAREREARGKGQGR